ncbi:MAG: cell surface protein [Duncaniella sp.]|uniref:PKD-like domain-containing protein n=1 Tax=Duncaniella sp. TaxID=2518496 RepID=UPI0023BE74D8|nr:PKD-like domain-containing protein [Duncaniella sp.]MDE5988459.1 cell surface protein [Duncaniella sp.]
MKQNILLFLYLLGLCCLWSCNTDNDLTAPQQDPITVSFDNQTGVYELKTGKSISITPTVKNAVNPRYKWIDDEGKTSANSLTLQFSSDSEGVFYFTFCVDADNGSAREEIRIDVLEKVVPTVTLPTEMQTTVGQELKIVPAVNTGGDANATYQWLLDGSPAGNDEFFIFKAETEGSHTLQLTVSNEDGNGSAEMKIEVVSQPQLSVSFRQSEIQVLSGRPVCLAPIVANANGDVRYEWSVDGQVMPDEKAAVFEYTPASAGRSVVSVKVSSDDLSCSASITVECLSATEDDRYRPATAESSGDRVRVFEFTPAPGQFVHQISATSMSDACREAERRLSAGQDVSLGAFGGYIIVGFDHSVKNIEGDYDFAIGGNSFRTSNEPGIVWVMQDENGNGLPDDTWYELRGSEADKAETIYNYSVTYYRPATAGSPILWADSRNNTGTLTIHPSWPSWLNSDSYNLAGTRLEARTTFTHEWSNDPFDWGYADNMGSDRLSDSENPNAEMNYNYFKIENAMSASRRPVSLKYIDFIKVQCGVNSTAGILGEVSTEVFGFLDCTISK